MYLHLGQNVVVEEVDVIGIFDLDNTTGSYLTRDFLGDAEKDGRLTNVTDELPKSFIVCSANESARNSGENSNKIYLSQLSPQTLYNRTKFGKKFSFFD